MTETSEEQGDSVEMAFLEMEVSFEKMQALLAQNRQMLIDSHKLQCFLSISNYLTEWYNMMKEVRACACFIEIVLQSVCVCTHTHAHTLGAHTVTLRHGKAPLWGSSHILYVNLPALALAFSVCIVPRCFSVSLGWGDRSAAAKDFAFALCVCVYACMRAYLPTLVCPYKPTHMSKCKMINTACMHEIMPKNSLNKFLHL